LKFKRGVTIPEYNFVDHSYIPDASVINDPRYSDEEVDRAGQELKDFNNEVARELLLKQVSEDKEEKRTKESVKTE
jgi:hypothetical protein